MHVAGSGDHFGAPRRVLFEHVKSESQRASYSASSTWSVVFYLAYNVVQSSASGKANGREQFSEQ